MLSTLLFALALGTTQPRPPVATVRAYLEALQAMDAIAMERFLAPDFTIVGPDGTVPYDREQGRATATWERTMKTNWGAQVIGQRGDSITVILTERSEFFRLLGIGYRTEVSVFVVREGLIRSEVSRFMTVARGTQGEAYREFKQWLVRKHVPPDPDLVGADGGLRFDGKSAPKMLAWLRRWYESPEGRAVRARFS